MNEFRVWDKKEKRYLDFKTLMLGMNGELFFPQKGGTWVTSIEPGRYEVEPSIGQRDVNNYQIYAGDFIECWGGISGIYWVHPNSVLTQIDYPYHIKYHLENTWKSCIVGNIHDNPLPDTALSQIYIVVKDWRGLFQFLLDRGWSISDLLKYENSNDLFHDIVKNERKCSKQWYTDVFTGYNWNDGDTVYVDKNGKIAGEDDPEASIGTLHTHGKDTVLQAGNRGGILAGIVGHIGDFYSLFCFLVFGCRIVAVGGAGGQAQDHGQGQEHC